VEIPGEGSFDDYDLGDIVPILAVPDPGYDFVCWTGDTEYIADIYASSTNITMNGNYNIGAIFAPSVQGGSTGTVFQHTRYTWDASGNLMTRNDLLTEEIEAFTYDFLDRLIGVTGPYTELYTYNTIGNIMSRNGADYLYGDPAHAHAVTFVGTKVFAYDANGNMTVRGTQSLVWDVENRLTSVSDNGTTIAEFVYDGDGNRVKKIENGETERINGTGTERRIPKL
jgi:YD repeat-containing protein